ncbi:OsmC domain-containing protein [Rhizoctonia solani AG-1 IA]|uniref:OsmC domain-containing protein n=1 Tax=Thanatephorus cucumeris (strain AG1-IA) TaxID=983506 RepID=L8WRP9_THACA|nr:OsmC domain-containing protein [Rhizoctonia solani AG-1 IA]
MFPVLRSLGKVPVFRHPLLQRRGVISLVNTKVSAILFYTATAIASGAGWDGRTELEDGSLTLDMAVPQEMGGTGNGKNPDQCIYYFFIACFLGALRLAAKNKNIKGHMYCVLGCSLFSIGDAEGSGFGLGVELTVIGADSALAQAAHEICPYSRLFKEGAEIKTAIERVPSSETGACSN